MQCIKRSEASYGMRIVGRCVSRWVIRRRRQARHVVSIDHAVSVSSGSQRMSIDA